MRLDQRQSLGAFGERVAAGYLERRGWQIVERRWRCPSGEIDLIARDGAALVFVEVRTRRAPGHASESITRAKQAQIRRLAYLYLGDRVVEWRIDAVAVDLDRTGRVSQIEHFVHVVEEG